MNLSTGSVTWLPAQPLGRYKHLYIYKTTTVFLAILLSLEMFLFIHLHFLCLLRWFSLAQSRCLCLWSCFCRVTASPCSPVVVVFKAHETILCWLPEKYPCYSRMRTQSVESVKLYSRFSCLSNQQLLSLKKSVTFPKCYLLILRSLLSFLSSFLSWFSALLLFFKHNDVSSFSSLMWCLSLFFK